MVMNIINGLLIICYLAIGMVVVGTVRELFITDDKHWIVPFNPPIRFICLLIWPIVVIIMLLVIVIWSLWAVIKNFFYLFKETFFE